MEGELLRVHAFWHRLEVWSQRAVGLSGDGDIPAVEYARMSLLPRRQRLHKRVVLARDARQHALILLTQFRSRVAVQECLDVHAQIGVLIHIYYLFRKTLGLTRGTLRAEGK